MTITTTRAIIALCDKISSATRAGVAAATVAPSRLRSADWILSASRRKGQETDEAEERNKEKKKVREGGERCSLGTCDVTHAEI